MGHATAHSYRGSLGHAQLARPTARPGVWPAHATGALPSARTTRDRHAWPWLVRHRARARRRLNDGGNPELLWVNSHWMTTYMLLLKNPEGEAGKV
jgi:hypothetical protein